MEERFAVARVAVAQHAAAHSALEIRQRVLRAALLHEKLAHRVVAADVVRIAAKRFIVIVPRAQRDMAVLLHLQALEVKLLLVFDLARAAGRAVRLRRLAALKEGLAVRVADHGAAFPVCQQDGDVLLLRACRDGGLAAVRRAGREGNRLLPHRLALHAHGQARVRLLGRDVHPHGERFPAEREPERAVLFGVFQIRQLGEAVPRLFEDLRLIRREEREIRLVVGVTARHDLQIGAVLVGEVAVPHVAELPAAPSEKFLAHRNIVVRHMDGAAMTAVVVAAHEVVIGIQDEERRRRGNVLEPGDVGAVAEPGARKLAFHDREGRHGVLIMIGDVVDIRRELELVVFVCGNSQVRPPVERLHGVRGVVKTRAHGHIGFVRPDGDAHHALHTEQRFIFAHPGRFGAVLPLFDPAVHRHVRCGAVMLRPVELDTAGYPGAGQADERRLDHLVFVDEMVVRLLVVALVDAAAELRQDDDADVIILEPDGIIFPVALFAAEHVAHGDGIHIAARPLMVAHVVKNRGGICLLHLIRGDHQFLPRNHFVSSSRFAACRRGSLRKHGSSTTGAR